MNEGDTTYFPNKDGYLIEVEWDFHSGRFIASARKEGTRSEHAIGITEQDAIDAVIEKIKTAERMGS